VCEEEAVKAKKWGRENVSVEMEESVIQIERRERSSKSNDSVKEKEGSKAWERGESVFW